MPHILFWGKADKMKHGTYVKGVATGVILTVLAGGGIKAVQYCRSDEILSDLAFTQKIKYLENMIDEEYLGEISTDKLEEGVYAGLITDWEMCIPDIIQKMSMSRSRLLQKDLMWVSELPCRNIQPVVYRS